MPDRIDSNRRDGICHARAWAVACILAGLLLTGCTAVRKIPQTDIVFQVYPADEDAESALGFVNADGWGYVVLPHITPYGMLPVWSPDGTQIAYRRSPPVFMSDYYGTVAVIGQEERCSWLGGNGRVRWLTDGSGLLTAIGEPQGLGVYRYSVISVTPGGCEVQDELYVASQSVHDPDLSSSGLLAFGRRGSIIVVDLATQEEQVVGEGVVPSWSPDGQWLAYTGADGLYIVRADGTEGRRVLEYCATCHTTHTGGWDDWPPLPEWSPDGEWLVYHREERGTYAIYRLNVQTGEEVWIADGGLNPDWRAGPGKALDRE